MAIPDLQTILEQNKSIQLTNDALVAEVKSLKLQSQEFERRLAALEGRSGGAATSQQVTSADVLPSNVEPIGFCPMFETYASHGFVNPAFEASHSMGVELVSEAMTQPQVDDPWLGASINDERLDMYRKAFLKADRNADGFCEPYEVNEVLDRAGLPNAEDSRAIWLLVDINGRGRLTFSEFACAMFVAFRRAKEGVPLPMKLPRDLLSLATSNVGASSPKSAEAVMPSFADAFPTDATPPDLQQSSLLKQPQAAPSMQQQQLDPFASVAAASPAGYPAQGTSPISSSPLDQLQQRLKTLEKADPFEVAGCAAPMQSGMPAAPSSQTSVPTFFESGSSAAAPDPFDQALSVKELKARLKQHGADITGLSEKCELLAMLKKVEASKKEIPMPQMQPTAAAAQFTPAACAASDPFAGLM